VTAPAYPPFQDPALGGTQPLNVRWTYWPVNYINGDPTVIGNAPLPLGGVQCSVGMRAVGQLKGSLQLADPGVRALYPWDKVIPRKTGIVAVRSTQDPSTGGWGTSWVGHYWVVSAPTEPATGRMKITALTIEGLWARRLITKAVTWSGVDQQQIAADLLNPAVFSKIALGAAPNTGWINIDPPTVPTGVARNFSYVDDQQTNLLTAHQARSQLATNPYEWTTTTRVLSGTDGESAASFRCQYVLGFPKLGRQLGQSYPVPRLVYDVNGTGGNVLSFQPQNDASNVENILWGRGNGYADLQVKTQVQYQPGGVNEWSLGFMQSEGRYSNPDVSDSTTLADQCYQTMYQSLSNQGYIANLKIRGDLLPYYSSYVVGDQMILATNDPTWPPDYYSASGYFEQLVRVYGWTITPPEGNSSETVDLLLASS
jgi:hypothetical protein